MASPSTRFKPISFDSLDLPPAAVNDVARTTKTNERRIERRRVYLGEGLTLRLRTSVASEETTGEVIDITPEGLGVALLTGGADLRAGGEITVEHTGRATAGVVQRAIVTNVGTETFGGRAIGRVGLAYCSERTVPGTAHDRRNADRFECSDEMPAFAAAQSPLFFQESLHFRVREIGAGGMTTSTSLRNKGLIKGMELSFRLNFNMIGVFDVRGRVTSIDREHVQEGFRVGVAWIEPPRALLNAIAEYLLLDDKSLTPARLRAAGLKISSIERAVSYGYAHLPDDYDEILTLRLRAHQDDEGHAGLTPEDMASPRDLYGRHVVCRFGGRIIIAGRLAYVGADRSKSDYTAKGHVIPESVWEAGFVEAGAGQTDPDFQRSGLYISFIQHCVRVAMQSGFRYIVFACADELVSVFENLGCSCVDTRTVEPKPGWRFQSHIMILDMEGLLSAPPEGKFVEAMASVAAFVDENRS